MNGPNTWQACDDVEGTDESKWNEHRFKMDQPAKKVGPTNNQREVKECKREDVPVGPSGQEFVEDNVLYLVTYCSHAAIVLIKALEGVATLLIVLTVTDQILATTTHIVIVLTYTYSYC